jgi:hypothetical protein
MPHDDQPVVGEWQAAVKELKLKKHGYPPKAYSVLDSKGGYKNELVRS